MTHETEDPQRAERVSRVIDFRIPLPWLLSGVAAIAWAMVGVWFSVNQLVKTVDELQIVVKSGNTSIYTMSGEIALLKFRLDNVENESKRINETLRSFYRGQK